MSKTTIINGILRFTIQKKADEVVWNKNPNLTSHKINSLLLELSYNSGISSKISIM